MHDRNIKRDRIRIVALTTPVLAIPQILLPSAAIFPSTHRLPLPGLLDRQISAHIGLICGLVVSCIRISALLVFSFLLVLLHIFTISPGGSGLEHIQKLTLLHSLSPLLAIHGRREPADDVLQHSCRVPPSPSPFKIKFGLFVFHALVQLTSSVLTGRRSTNPAIS